MREIYTFGVKTAQLNAMVNITSEINKAIRESGVKSGICVVFVPHTTAGITVNENADPDVVRDFIMDMNKIIPKNDDHRRAGGNSSVHTRTSLTGCSLTLIVDEGRLLLGTWQGIYFMEFDGPGIRKVHVKIIEG
ncbi:MAG TPA: YjbQ family protein [Clostridiales bacterium]|nr:YjbQ family protein [Clostridiales bacterium]